MISLKDPRTIGAAVAGAAIATGAGIMLWQRRSPHEIGKYLNGLISVEYSKSLRDLSEVVAIERECWPLTPEAYQPDESDVWQADEERFRNRQAIGALYLARYTGNFSSVDVNGKPTPVRRGEIMAHGTAYRCGWTNAGIITNLLFCTNMLSMDWNTVQSDFGFPGNFYQATDYGWVETEYSPSSDVMHLISVNVPERFRGLLTYSGGKSSVIDVLTHGILEDAKDRGVRYVIGITTLPNYDRSMTPQEYVVARREDGSRLDPNLRRYERNGAEIICAAPNYMPCDRRSNGHGALVVYPV